MAEGPIILLLSVLWASQLYSDLRVPREEVGSIADSHCMGRTVYSSQGKGILSAVEW